MAKRKEEKTNVMRTLEQKRIPYTGYTYPHEEGVAVDGETVAALLGPELPPETEGSSTTAEQLGRIAEQLAVKNRRARRIWKIAAGVLIAFAAVNLLLILLNFAAFRSFTTEAEITVENQAVPAAEASIQTS